MIVVAGEALIDLIVAPDGGLTANPGGGPYNAARTISRLGGRSAFLGRVSTDHFGRDLRSRLENDGVDLDLCVTTEDPTTLAVAELDAGGAASYRFYTAGTSAAGLIPRDGPGSLPPSTRAFHVGTLGLVLEPTASTLEAMLGRLDDHVLVLVDPNCRPAVVDDPAAYRARIARILQRADVVKVSGDDLEFLSPGTSPVVVARELVASGVPVVLFTDGGRAVHVLTDSSEYVVPVPPVEVVDTVGAGDAFGGAFLTAWVARGLGRDDLGDGPAVRDAVMAAIQVASFTCMRQGADPPHLSELEPAVAAAFNGAASR
jgi:fructokinase